jgi:hypothetical protein
MKKRSIVLIFISSVALGWLSRGSVSAINPPQIVKPSQTRPERKTEIARTDDAREAEFLAFVKRVPTLNDGEKDALTKNLAPKDRGALIKTLLEEGDPSGLSSEAKRMMKNILEVWVAEDFEGAWNWSQQITNDAFRRCVSATILEAMAEKDFSRALALCNDVNKADPQFICAVGLIALEKTASKSADDFLEVLASLSLIDKACRGGFEFAKDFDFQKLAEGASKLLKKQKRLPNAFPSDFITTWAERDPDAALAWLASDNNSLDIPFTDLLEGIEKQGIPGVASAWIANKIEESETSWKLVVEGMSNAPAASINGIVKALANPNTSDRFLTELFINQCNFYPYNFTTTLPGMSSPQARLKAFAQVKKAGNNLAEKITVTQYQSWGITKQQFDEIFPPTAKH